MLVLRHHLYHVYKQNDIKHAYCTSGQWGAAAPVYAIYELVTLLDAVMTRDVMVTGR